MAEKKEVFAGKLTELINGERQRQASKGFDAKHDDAHDKGELIALAIGVLDDVSFTAAYEPAFDHPWIWETIRHIRKRHGTDTVRMLTIAAAILVAEIERLQRRPSDD